ncbi:metal-nicotianamine transporter YSL1 isoform X1 [Nicotiana tomentosiformis]|uniref:metal-nicotianamine transporter YSL1 isoform X1 n=2 Tax=Nicotiana tomentosiformis TaxID=4098 RepID=UPI000877FB56|nr:metal-nicotianamine transporter YSL1-like isoform X3 [Nicotiana tomentosiformis]
MQIVPSEDMNNNRELEQVRDLAVEEHEGEEEEEQLSESTMRIQPWTKQITLRGIIASTIIGCIYSVIQMKMNLTTGINPNLNVSAALLAYIFIQTWTKILKMLGFVSVPFTRQENTMIQTCSVACYSIALGGGLGSYLLGMDKKTYELAGVGTMGNTSNSYKKLEIGWMIGYLLVVCFIGLFVLVPLRKVLIVDYKLTFPTGMATAVLINGFHGKSDKLARKQVKSFLKFFSYSFSWAFFQWFYTGKEDCGFQQFPTFGLKAWKQTFYFDFSLTYVGTGMICPHIVNISLLLGAVLSWGVMWPLIAKLKGEWFPADIPESSMKSLNGYKVFISIALLLGDGLYNFVKIMYFTLGSVHERFKRKNLSPAAGVRQNKNSGDVKYDEAFLRESIPMWFGGVGYLALGTIAVIMIPLIFHEIKWYWVIIAYLFAPSLAFCNAYGSGLTDINMAYNYGKVGLFMMAALAGKEHGVIAGLAGCGLIKSVANVSCILMQDFKTGHLTLTSPKTMFLSQAIGTALGCVIGPLSFFLFYNAFDIGNPNGEFKAPYALIYRNMAIISVQGVSALPHHCLQLCYGFFAFAVAINMVKDLSPEKIGKWMPLPMAMAVPFLIGGYFGIDMCIGSLVVFVWHKLNSKKAKVMVPAVASGLICGEGLWILPASILALARVTPPICMKFLAS